MVSTEIGFFYYLMQLMPIAIHFNYSIWERRVKESGRKSGGGNHPESNLPNTNAFYCGHDFHPRSRFSVVPSPKIWFCASGKIKSVSMEFLQTRARPVRRQSSVARQQRIDLTVHFNLFTFHFSSLRVSFVGALIDGWLRCCCCCCCLYHLRLTCCQHKPADLQYTIPCIMFSFSITPQSSPIVNYVIKLLAASRSTIVWVSRSTNSICGRFVAFEVVETATSWKSYATAAQSS